MNVDDLKKIVEIIENSDVDVLNVEKGDFKLNFQKNSAQITDGKKNVSASVESDVKKILTDSSHSEQAEDSELHEMLSPMVGTFYSRPEPDKEPYVTVGSKISQGDIVCVLEAMKLLNEVRADVDGEIVEVLANDGDVIEFNQPLFSIKVSE